MIDLEGRLARGPLRVRSLWSADRGERFEGAIVRRRRRAFLLDVGAACACVALLVVAARTQPHLRMHVERPVEAVAPSTTTFTDGSLAELVGHDSALRIEEDTAQRVLATLTGGARFHVVHNPQRPFQVKAGEVRVRVLGTTFSIVQIPSGQTQVLVEQGRVEVAWLGGATELQTGEGGVFPPPDLAPLPIEPSQPTTDDAKQPGPLPSVRDEAADGLQAADAARLGGHPEQAVRLLRDLCDRHPSDRRAPVAAFTAGRILIDDLARPSEAANAFHRARVLWPHGPLAEDALAREADAWQKAGNSARGRALASQYLDLYPQGRHVAALRSLAP